MIKLKDISKSYQGVDILSNISFNIDDNQKIGLVGKNGVGKTTLLKIISGIEEYSSGTIEYNGILKKVGYLKQEFDLQDLDTLVTDYIDKKIGLTEIQNKLKKLEDSDLTIQKNFEEFCQLQELFINMDGYNIEYKKQITFSGLNLDKDFLTRPIKTLSAGQKSKVLLATLLLEPSDVLLLDEPTNNLDMSSIKWLENYLLSINLPCVIVSHDRKLLDAIVNKIVEIDQDTKGINEYNGNYSDYISYKNKMLNKQLEEYNRQQEKIEDMTASIKQKKKWANVGRYQVMSDKDKYTKGYERDRASSLASSAKRIETQLDKMKKVEKPIIHEPLKIDINVSDDTKSNIYIQTNNLICGYKDSFSVNVGNCIFDYGDRVIVMGNNGTGKTTFLNTVLGDLKPIEGSVVIGRGVIIGTLMQQNLKTFNESLLSIEEYIFSNVKVDKNVVYNLMIKFGFLYEDRLKSLKILSPGERVRLQLLICSLKEINTLIFDEPTNYLDIDAINAIEEVISSFPGIIIISSHDREFINTFNAKYKMNFTKKGVELTYLS